MEAHGGRHAGQDAKEVLSFANRTDLHHGDGGAALNCRRRFSRRAFPNKRGQFRLADKDGLAAIVGFQP